VAYQLHWQAYDNIFTRLGMNFIVVGADTGMMGGSASHEFMAYSPNGEDTILVCPNGDYAANREVALFRRDAASTEELAPMEEVETLDTTTIAALAELLNIPTSRTAKAVFYTAESGKFVFAVIRGDLEVNETKLRKVVNEGGLTPATVDEIRAHGAEPGYGSPVGVRDAIIVVDDSVRDARNLVAGANKVGWHLLNVNLGRDFEANIVGDIASAEAGFTCPHCGAAMTAERAIEVGNIFKLGTRYSEALGVTFQDAEGQEKPVQMGSYGIGSGRAAATIVEQRHDAKGIDWPVEVAPFPVSLMWIGAAEDAETIAVADELYAGLKAAGLEPLYDDRGERAGVKFNDADLIGNPVRVSVSKRTLERGEAEIKARRRDQAIFVPLADVLTTVQTLLAELRSEENES
jgi:prolyl-tRNA synthetase